MLLRKFIFRAVLFFILSTSLVITGCDKTEDVPAVIENTIAGIILNDSNFSSLEAVMVKANVATTFNGTDLFTVFAPDNAAFAASGITPTFINGLSQAQAQNIFLYHSLISKVVAADLPTGPNAQLTTFHGDSVFVTKDTNGVFVNGNKLIQADIMADNGVLHKIDRVLMPPAVNITQTIIENGLDSLGKAIARATNDTTGDSSLDSMLNSSMVTMFAPNDSAFTYLLTSLSLSNINDISVDSLSNILKYHLTSGRLFTSDLSDGSLTMLDGGTTTINRTNGISGGPTIAGANNGGNPSNITLSNLISRNGVVHIIDRVLIP